MWLYYSKVIHKAWASWMQRMHDSRRAAVIFFVQTTLLFAVLYFLPWLGSTEDQGRSVILLVVSVVGSTVLMFIWDLICAPVEMDQERETNFRKLRDIVVEGQTKEGVCDQLSNLHERGKNLYYEYSDFPEWSAKMEAWSHEVSDYITDHLMLSSKYRFIHPIHSGGGYHTDWKWDNVDASDDFKIKSLYTSRIIALRDVIVNAPDEISLTKLGAADLIMK